MTAAGQDLTSEMAGVARGPNRMLEVMLKLGSSMQNDCLKPVPHKGMLSQHCVKPCKDKDSHR